MSIRQDYNVTSDSQVRPGYFGLDYRGAQSFTASASYTIESIKLYMKRVGTPNEIDVRVYEADDDGWPVGEILSSGQIDGNAVSSSSYQIQTCTMSSYAIVEGSEYVIVVQHNAISFGNYMYYKYNTTSSYAGGHYSYEGGSGWSSSSGDLWFETYSADAGGGAPSKPTTPSPANAATEVDFSTFVLSWADGGDADTFDVYIGDTGSVVQVSSTQAGTTYTTTLAEIEAAIGASPIEQQIYWRVDASNENGTTTGDEWTFDARPGQASSPSPSDEGTDANAGLTVTWTEGTNATTETMNGGTTGNVAELETGLTDQEYNWSLTYETGYQWRVDSVNQFGTTTGSTWSFTTVSIDPPLSDWENLPGKTLGPTDGGTEGTDYRWLGTNNMSTVKRLVAAAASALWYEDK